MDKMTIEQLREKHRKERIIREREIRRRKRELYKAITYGAVTILSGIMTWATICILFAA